MESFFLKTTNDSSKKSPFPWLLSLLLFAVACGNDSSSKQAQKTAPAEKENSFDPAKWKIKEGADYPYRAAMLQNVLYNDSIRSLSKTEILALLGEPSYYRNDTNFLYYQIQQKRLGLWPWHTQILVIHFLEDQSIDWMKVHE